MAGSLNKVMLIGNLGNDPEIRALPGGGKVANLSIATSETWKDKNTGEKKEKTEWHRVVIWTEGLVGVVEKYLSKGDKVMIEGSLQTRKWTDQAGVEKYSTEIVLQGFGSQLLMLSTKDGAAGAGGGQGGSGGGNAGNGGGGTGRRPAASAPAFESGGMDDDIPF